MHRRRAPRRSGPTPEDGTAPDTEATPIGELPPETVRLSEIVAYQGIGPDFIEIVNTGEAAVAMAGAELWADDRNDQEPRTFPEGVVIEPGEHLVVLCIGVASQGPLEATFRLAREGGEVMLTTTTRLVGEAPGDQAGMSVGAGDVNGNGFDDLLIGARLNDSNGTSSGAVYLVHGPVLAPLLDLGAADARILGDAPSAQAGTSVSGGGDLNGDGFDDILIGTPAYRVGAT